MIHDVDEALKTLVTREALNGSGVEVTFEAPTKEWAARRNTPTLDLYLYDIREDLQRRLAQFEPVRDESGRVIERRPPPRRFKLSYLVTAWTQRPEDEHRLLAAVLGCVLRYEALPVDVLPRALADQPLPVLVTIALPPPEDRSPSDLWTALGGELKPNLDLVVTAPFDTARVMAAGPPVLEEPRLSVIPANARSEGPTSGRHARSSPRSKRATGEDFRLDPADAEGAVQPEPDEIVFGGRPERPGRTVRIRRTR